MATFISNWCRRKSSCSRARSSRLTCRAPKAISACWPATRPWSPRCGPACLTVHGAGGAQRIVVLGGFAEVSAQGLTVLADVAEAVEGIDRAMITERIGTLESRIAKTEPGSELDRLITRLDHYKDVDRHLTGTAIHLIRRGCLAHSSSLEFSMPLKEDVIFPADHSQQDASEEREVVPMVRDQRHLSGRSHWNVVPGNIVGNFDER